jgi:hypothetical protein
MGYTKKSSRRRELPNLAQEEEVEEVVLVP